MEEVLLEPFRGDTPHERYGEALERAGLSESELARRWSNAAAEALASPVDVVLPKDEAGRFGPDEPTALGYRIQLRRGQRLDVHLDLDEAWGGSGAPRVFMEVFRERSNPEAEEPRLLTLAWTEPDERTLTHEARATAFYILRVQPELLVGGDYRLSFRTGPSLAFPVENRDTRAIQSVFGDPREGGRRQHHGVDIFAPRGTPVLAAAEGVVTRVAETPIGGRVVWVRDRERGVSQYYAHLHTQLVEPGAHVLPGDVLGTVGNTGNARTTPPHLHFGLYVRGEGPVDPWHFLHDPGGRAAPLRVERDSFRQMRQVAGASAPVRSSPSERGRVVLEAESGALVRVLGGSGSFLRVRLSDGRQGYVAEPFLTTPGTALEASSSAAGGS